MQGTYVCTYCLYIRTSENRHYYRTVSYLRTYLLDFFGWVRRTYVCTYVCTLLYPYICVRLQRNKQNQVTFPACTFAHMHAAEQCDVVDDTCSSCKGHSRTGWPTAEHQDGTEVCKTIHAYRCTYVLEVVVGGRSHP